MGNVVLRPTRLPDHAPTRRTRRRKKGRMFRGLVVVIGAMALTTVAIKASDSFAVPGRDLMGGVGASVPSARCPEEMVFVASAQGGFCVDRYEASPGKLCPHSTLVNQFDTNDNLAESLCAPVSVAGVAPWVNLPRAQAMELCVRAGKRLPTNAEWFRAALGTPDDKSSCVLARVGQSVADPTGSHPTCVSSLGVFDMVGNVWEWVDANVKDGTMDGVPLPAEGFIVEADTNGIPLRTGPAGDEVFHHDYLFLDAQGPKGVFRGGFWYTDEKAGVYTMNAASPSTFVGSAVGFRCVK